MKSSSGDSSVLAQKLREFLIGAGWTPVKQVRGLSFFSPPESLGIRGKYSIALPEDASRPSVSGLIHDAADTLVQIYGYNKIGDLLNRASSLESVDQSTRIVARFLDDMTRGGSIPLSALAAYVSHMEVSLYRSAKFQLGSESGDADLIAKQFAKDSLFLQTSVGSFIAKVEVPSSVLRQADLFGNPQIESTQVASSLFSAIQFLNEEILKSNVPFDDSKTLENVIALFNLELLTALSDVLLGTEMKSIDFSFEFGNKVRMTSTGWITPEKRKRLKDFVHFVRDQLRGESDIDVTGSIVELRSRDPEGDKNHVCLVANFYGDRVFFTATLNNIHYQRAVDAHRLKRGIRLSGKGIRLKTQVRVTEISVFE